MKFTHLSAMAALALTLTAGAALAADATTSATSKTTATVNAPTLDTAMAQSGSTSESRGTYFTGLTPAYKQGLMDECQKGMGAKTLTADQTDFCKSMTK